MMGKKKLRDEDGDDGDTTHANANDAGGNNIIGPKKKNRSSVLAMLAVVVAAIGFLLLPMLTEDGFHRDYLSALKSSESESRTRDLEQDQKQQRMFWDPTTKTDATITNVATEPRVHSNNNHQFHGFHNKTSNNSRASPLPTTAPTNAPSILLPITQQPAKEDQNQQDQQPQEEPKTFSISPTTNNTASIAIDSPPLFMPRQIYICGFNKKKLYLYLFPEHTQLWESFIRLDRKNARQSKANDILVVGVGGYCDGWGDKKISAWGIRKRFKGRVIHLNGESFSPHVACESCPKFLKENGGKPPARQYHIGYEPDSPISVQVTFLAMFFVENFWNLHNQTFYDALVVPEKRPINTGERFLVYSAKHCVDFREDAFDRFALLPLPPNTTVDHASKCNGTIANTTMNNIKRVYGPKNYQDNYQFFHNYRFCLVLENAKVGGYITEKILAAFLGGCIPIYYGTLEIFDIFNPKAFVYYDIEHPQEAVDIVQRLEQNKSAYQEMLREPILRHGQQTMEEYFSLSDEIVPNAKLKRKIRDLILRPES